MDHRALAAISRCQFGLLFPNLLVRRLCSWTGNNVMAKVPLEDELAVGEWLESQKGFAPHVFFSLPQEAIESVFPLDPPSTRPSETKLEIWSRAFERCNQFDFSLEFDTVRDATLKSRFLNRLCLFKLPSQLIQQNLNSFCFLWHSKELLANSRSRDREESIQINLDQFRM